MLIFLGITCGSLLLLLTPNLKAYVIVLSSISALIALWFSYKCLWCYKYEFRLSENLIVVISVFGKKEIQLDDLETYTCRYTNAQVCRFVLRTLDRKVCVITRYSKHFREILHENYILQNQWRSQNTERIMREELAFLADFGFVLKDTSTPDKVRIEFFNEKIYFAYCRAYRFGEESFIVAKDAWDCYNYKYLATFSLYDAIFQTAFEECKKLFPKQSHTTTKLLAYYLKKQLQNHDQICGFEY